MITKENLGAVGLSTEGRPFVAILPANMPGIIFFVKFCKQYFHFCPSGACRECMSGALAFASTCFTTAD